MKIQTKRDTDFVEESRVVIKVGEVEFRLSLNKQNELIINKFQAGDGEGHISVIPVTSNEIKVI